MKINHDTNLEESTRIMKTIFDGQELQDEQDEETPTGLEVSTQKKGSR